MKKYGEKDTERLFLETADIYSHSQSKTITVKKTELPDMPDLIARHKARYGLVALFCRPGLKVLDFPCGSGYGGAILQIYGVLYEGRDNDPVAIEYANHVYRRSDYYQDRFAEQPVFIKDILSAPSLLEGRYDVIACIEGIEHIGPEDQKAAVRAFYKALKPGGVLIMSSPEVQGGPISGPSETNKYHKWELTRCDLNLLLYEGGFNLYDIDIITQVNKLHTGETANCFYAVCRKDEESAGN